VTVHLPVAGRAEVRRATARLIRADGRVFAAVLALNALAAAAGLVGPWLLGRMVDDVRDGGGVGAVDGPALVILVASLVQLLLSRWAGYVGYRFGERTLARVREEFVERTLALPASVVERAGTGDLTARGTADVTVVGTTLRDTGPQLLISGVQALFVLVAVFVIDPLLGACGVLGLTGIVFALRWYLRRARTAYLAQGAATSEVAEILAATASGARTVEAFGLGERRIRASRDALEVSRVTRMRTLLLFSRTSTCHRPARAASRARHTISAWSASSPARTGSLRGSPSTASRSGSTHGGVLPGSRAFVLAGSRARTGTPAASATRSRLRPTSSTPLAARSATVNLALTPSRSELDVQACPVKNAASRGLRNATPQVDQGGRHRQDGEGGPRQRPGFPERSWPGRTRSRTRKEGRQPPRPRPSRGKEARRLAAPGLTSGG